ncbi:MAG: endonuclease/exonuclease/phosphatase family protein [Romboutsia sp.]|uniref:endonuclease/exonuclease/phosphatase family protein n=1 Tax=Romboutsia sp. TaxID=1965302 RepID=UPI003F37E839
MRVATFNIRYDEINDKENAWVNRKDKVCSMLNFHEWDVFGLQEVLNHQLEYIREQLPEYDYVGVAREDGKEEGEFAPIFYKRECFDLEESDTFWLSETPAIPSKSWGAACTRICTFAKLVHKKSQKRTLIMNIHFDHESEEARYKSVKLLIEKAGIVANDEAVIILGDFNSEPNERCYKEISSIFNDVSAVSKQPYYGPKGTFMEFKFEEKWDNFEEIDHIFVNEKIEVKKAATLTDNIDRKYLSDHLPVVATLSINN